MAGALDDVERGRQQHVAAEGEDDGRCVQRTQPPEAGPRQIEIERREGQLPGDHVADQEAGDAPEHRGDHRELDRSVMVGDVGGDAMFAAETADDHIEAADQRGDREHVAVERHGRAR